MINCRVGGFSILPFDKFEIRSNLSREEAGAAIYNNVDFRLGLSLLFGRSSEKEFRGKVEGTTFKVMRMIGYRNSFLPVISGTIERNTYNVGGSQIAITMRVNWFVMVFSMIWMTVVTSIALNQMIQLINGKEISEISLVPIGMFVFGFLLINGGFSYEASKARKALINIFEGEELK